VLDPEDENLKKLQVILNKEIGEEYGNFPPNHPDRQRFQNLTDWVKDLGGRTEKVKV